MGVLSTVSIGRSGEIEFVSCHASLTEPNEFVSATATVTLHPYPGKGRVYLGYEYS